MSAAEQRVEREVVVVLGGTGTIGQYLVPRLCALLPTLPHSLPHSHTHIVRVVSRDIHKASVMFAPLGSFTHSHTHSGDSKAEAKALAREDVTLQLVQGDVHDLASMQESFTDATRVFLLTLTSLMQQQVVVERRLLALLGNSPEHGGGSIEGLKLKHIVRLSAHSRGMEGQPSNSPFRWHSECDEQLLQACSERGVLCGTASTVAVTILRPSLFMQDMTRRHFAPLIVSKDIFYQLGCAPSSGAGVGAVFEDRYRIAMVDARDIADVAACVLSEDTTKHAYNTYILSGPRALLWGDVAAAISHVCGRQIKADLLSDKAFYDHFGGSHVYLKQMQAYRSGCGEDVDGDIEVVTGRPARSIEEFCSDFVSSWVSSS